jgi:hypothetical protein
MKILFFAPNSAIWGHAFPEALIAEALMQQGHEIVYIGCGGLLDDYCISMSAHDIPFAADREKKQRICRLCKKNKEIICEQFGFAGFDLSDKYQAADLNSIEEIITSVTPENCLELTLNSVEVGKIALYEILLDSKKSNLDFSPSEWERYKSSLKNALLVFHIAQRMFNQIHPDRLVVYNALYAVNRVFCRLAGLHGVPQYFLHAGGNLSKRIQTLILAKHNTVEFYRHMLEKWKEFKEHPCPHVALKAVTDHFLEVFKGRSAWAYSVAAKGSSSDLKSFFGIDSVQKVICATLSSYDERFAAETVGVLTRVENLMFTKQVDWVKALIEYVADRNDLALLIRVHPREFPNKRENMLSEHAKVLQEVFSKTPQNVRVNWPTDNISLYDLASITDVFLNAWSSSGKEMALLGIPVVLYSSELVFYPSELNYVGTTEKEYFLKLEEALQAGWDSERIRMTYRWCAMEYDYSLLDIGESFAKNDLQQRLPFFSRKFNKLLTFLKPCRQQMSDCKNRSQRLMAATNVNKIIHDQLHSILDIEIQYPFVSEEEETIGLKHEVHRLLCGLYSDPEAEAKSNALACKLLNFANSK